MSNSNSREIISDKLRNFGGNSTESSTFEMDLSKNEESQTLNRISENEDDALSLNDKHEQPKSKTIKSVGLVTDSNESAKTEANDKNCFSNSTNLNMNSGIISNKSAKPSPIHIKENIFNTQNVSFSQPNIRNKSACVEDGVVVPDVTSSTPSAATSLLNPTRLDSTNRMNSTNSTGNWVQINTKMSLLFFLVIRIFSIMKNNL